MAAIHLLIGTLGLASLALAAAYTLLALVAVLVWGRRKRAGSAVRLPCRDRAQAPVWRGTGPVREPAYLLPAGLSRVPDRLRRKG